jgi:hypothetical protein
MMKLPMTAKALLLDDELLQELQDALAPPKEARLDAELEVEIEVQGEGTFVLTYIDGTLSGDEGMADEPFVSIEVPKGAHGFVVELLEEARAGFPKAPELAARLSTMRGLSRELQQEALTGVKKLDGAAAEIDVVGTGVFRMARGPLDEAVRKVRVTVPTATVRGIVHGTSLAAVSGVKVSGDSRLPGDMLAALGNVWLRLKQPSVDKR